MGGDFQLIHPIHSYDWVDSGIAKGLRLVRGACIMPCTGWVDAHTSWGAIGACFNCSSLLDPMRCVRLIRFIGFTDTDLLSIELPVRLTALKIRDVLFTVPDSTGLCTLVHALLSTSVSSIRSRDLLIAVLSTRYAPYAVLVITSQSILVL